MEFRRSRLLEDHTMATEVIERDLPVNPLSHVIITMSACNMANEATLAEFLAFLNSVQVIREGVAQVSLESEDLHALDTFLLGSQPLLTQIVATDNATRQLTLIVPFGRRLMNPNECLPASQRGESRLRVDTTIPSSSLDQGVINIEVVQLIGATPTRYLRTVLQSVSAPGATGDHDVVLPIGNTLAGILLWNATVPATDSHVYTLNAVRLLRNEKEFGYVSASGACLKGDDSLYFSPVHRDIAAAGNVIPTNYMFMDYGARFGDEFLLDTGGLTSLKLRIDYGVDEAGKVIPLVLVGAEGAG